jgi:ATP-dependent Clp protease ATP-binding subunit ClpA
MLRTMFERFTDRARRVVVLAQEEARVLHHNYIGTEHILLGLLREREGVAARVLERIGVSAEAVRDKVAAIIGEGGDSPTGHIPFTPRAKKVLELSLREALQLGHNYIGTEHILLGLVREGEGVAAQVLVNLGAELSGVRLAVVNELRRMDPRTEIRPMGPARTPETPAVAKAGVQARRLAGGSAVGSQHYLMALLGQEDSLAAKALADLGVSREAVEAKLAQLEPTGTSDETPEEAGARRIGMRVEGKLLMLEIDDPELATALEKAMTGRKVRIIKGTDPEAAGFPGLWSAVSRTVEDLTRRLGRAGGRGAAVPTEMATFTPGEWDPTVDAANYRIVSQSDGTRAYLEVSPDVDREALRSWLREWLVANRQALPQPELTEAAGLSFVIQRAGTSFAIGRFHVVPAGPGATMSLDGLVEAALRDLSAQV